MDSEKLYLYLKNNHIGNKNAVLSKQLETAFSCKGTEIRRCINTLRSRGIPICSSADGYFYSENPADIARTVSQLRGRVLKIENAQHGMAKNLLKEG